MLCKTAAGLGKYGSGNQCQPAVMSSHAQRSNTAAVNNGRIRHTATRSRRQRCWPTAIKIDTIKNVARKFV